MTTTPPFQQRAIDAIRAEGGRITPQREILLDLLAQAANGIDADQLYQSASVRDPNISLPTIYRTLHTLEEAHLITAHYASSDHERKVYHIRKDEDLFHFTCRKCGRVTAFHSDTIAQIKQELTRQLDADVLKLCMCADGLCEQCRQQS